MMGQSLIALWFSSISAAFGIPVPLESPNMEEEIHVVQGVEAKLLKGWRPVMRPQQVLTEGVYLISGLTFLPT